MKILHVAHGYSPSVGGTQTMVQQISERLVADYGDEVTVFTTVAYNNAYFWDRSQPALSPGTEWINGVKVVRFAVFNRFGRWRLNLARVAHKLRLPGEDWLRGMYFGPIVPGLTQTISKSSAQVIMASAFPLLHMHNALAGGQRAGIPVTYMGALHTTDPWCFERKMIYDAIARCDAYFALTAYERDYLVKRNIGSDKIKLVGAGIDLRPYQTADRQSARQHFGWGDELVIATVARHLPHKRLDVLIKAMGSVWASVPDARLVIAGIHGSHTPELEALMKQYPAAQQHRITLLKDITQDDKVLVMMGCDVFAMLSSHEAFGLVFLEAWACGKPVIAANIGALPSVVQDGIDGVLVDYDNPQATADAIIRLWQQPELRESMGHAGRAKVEQHYTWDIVTRAFRETYEYAVDKHKE